VVSNVYFKIILNVRISENIPDAGQATAPDAGQATAPDATKTPKRARSSSQSPPTAGGSRSAKKPKGGQETPSTKRRRSPSQSPTSDSEKTPKKKQKGNDTFSLYCNKKVLYNLLM